MSLIPNLTLAVLLADLSKVSAVSLESIPELRAGLVRLDTLLQMRVAMAKTNGPIVPGSPRGEPELIDSRELAERLSVPESWVRDCVRNRSGDPIPCVRLGRYVRFEWGSPDLEAWFGRRKEGKKKQLDRKMVSVYQ